MAKKRKTIFHEPKFDKYAKIVSTKNSEEAHTSVAKLREEYNGAKQGKKKLRILRIANESSNRAGIMANNKKISQKVRQEKLKVQRIYRKLTNELSEKYLKNK